MVPKDRIRTMQVEEDKKAGSSGLKEGQRRDAVVKRWNKKSCRQRGGRPSFILGVSALPRSSLNDWMTAADRSACERLFRAPGATRDLARPKRR